MNTIPFGAQSIAQDAPPVIVAELSGNHQGSLEQALALVDAAAQAGAHAIKLQTYTADTMTLDVKTGEFFIHDAENIWQGQSLYELYQQAHTPWSWHEIIFKHAREKGMFAFSAPFDASAIDFLETLETPIYKIASFENTDLPLIEKAAKTGKPLIISTGMASIAELDDAVKTARAAGCQQLILLKCTSSYPAQPDEIHLATIAHLQQMFQCHVGLSDHTQGIGVAIAAVALGARMIEKHLVLSRDSQAVDALFSIEPHELAQLVIESKRAWQAVGHVQYGVNKTESIVQKHRRSLYIAKDLKAGERLTTDNLRIIRPGLGVAPKYFAQFLSKPVRKDVTKGTPVSWDLI